MYYKFTAKLFISLLFLMAVSCNDPDKDENWGAFVLSSEFDFTSSSIVGYNFELKTYKRFPSGDDPVPDIILDKYTLPGGEIFPGFSSPSNDAGFALVSESGALVEALEFFDTYQEFNPATALSPSTDTIKKFQVWVLKNSMENYIKMVVKDILYLQNVSGDYIKVSIEYYHQDDGTPFFEKK